MRHQVYLLTQFWYVMKDESGLPRSDFMQWNDISLGNCFTFNHKNASHQKFSEQPGSIDGMRQKFSCHFIKLQNISQVSVYPSLSHKTTISSHQWALVWNCSYKIRMIHLYRNRKVFLLHQELLQNFCWHM